MWPSDVREKLGPFVVRPARQYYERVVDALGPDIVVIFRIFEFESWGGEFNVLPRERAARLLASRPGAGELPGLIGTRAKLGFWVLAFPPLGDPPGPGELGRGDAGTVYVLDVAPPSAPWAFSVAQLA